MGFGDFFNSTIGKVALGPVGGAIGSALFPSNSAGSDAGAIEAQFNQLGIGEIGRQFDITQGNIQPFMQAGTQALPGLQQASTAGGLDQRFAELADTDIFGTLVDERTRSIQNQLASSGLTRSGAGVEEAANIPTDILLMLEQLTGGRLQNLAGAGQNAAVNLGGFGAQKAGAIAGLQQDTGRRIGGGLIIDQQADAAQQGQLLNAGATVGAALFSDSRLKENIKLIGKVKDLSVYSWNWLKEAKGTLAGSCPEFGFMWDEVKEKYPQHAYEFGGFGVIDHPSLIREMEVA